jgi:hypothetical protein
LPLPENNIPKAKYDIDKKTFYHDYRGNRFWEIPTLLKAAEFKVSGIKCDHCDFKDSDVKYEQYPEYIDKECPVCKNNLLTQDDYQKCKNLILATKIYNVIVFPLHIFKYTFSKEYRNSNFTQSFSIH